MGLQNIMRNVSFDDISVVTLEDSLSYRIRAFRKIPLLYAEKDKIYCMVDVIEDCPEVFVPLGWLVADRVTHHNKLVVYPADKAMRHPTLLRPLFRGGDEEKRDYLFRLVKWDNVYVVNENECVVDKISSGQEPTVVI
jgi:hypothetical protein